MKLIGYRKCLRTHHPDVFLSCIVYDNPLLCSVYVLGKTTHAPPLSLEHGSGLCLYESLSIFKQHYRSSDGMVALEVEYDSEDIIPVRLYKGFLDSTVATESVDRIYRDPLSLLLGGRFTIDTITVRKLKTIKEIPWSDIKQ